MKTPIVGTVLASAVLLAGGCASRPLGRVDVGSTTPAEDTSPGPSVAQFAEATDTAARSLAAALPGLAPLPGGTATCIVLGRTENLTGGLVPTSELELARDRVLAKVDIERRAAGRIVVHTSVAEHERLVREDLADHEDDLLARNPSPRPSKFDPRSTFELTSRMGTIERGTTRLATYEFALIRASDGARVWLSRAESKRDGGQRSQVPQPDQDKPARPTGRREEDRIGSTIDTAGDAVRLADRIRDLSK